MKKRRKDIIRILSAQKIGFLHLIKKQKKLEGGNESVQIFLLRQLEFAAYPGAIGSHGVVSDMKSVGNLLVGQSHT